MTPSLSDTGLWAALLIAFLGAVVLCPQTLLSVAGL
jgi:hypothetical protein